MKAGAVWSRNVHSALVLAGVLAAVACVPIPLGSNRPYAWFGFEFLIYALVVLWALGAVFYRDYKPPSRSVLRIVLILLVWLGCILVQAMPVPEAVVEGLNPLVHALRRDLALISVDAEPALSIDPGNTYNEFLKYGAYIAVFALILATVTTQARLLWAVAFIVAAGVLEAVFGLYTNLTGFVILPENPGEDELRAGTFVNRNHYANLLTMVLGMVFGLMTALVNARSPGDHSGSGQHKDANTALLLVLLAASLILLAGIFTSGSRAPIVFFSLSFVVLLFLFRNVRGTKTGELILAPVILLGVALVIVFIGFDNSFIRLLDRDLFGGERMLQNTSGFSLLAVVWAAGVGAGNYQWVFPMFRGDGLRFATYDHAHNDYLEAAIEQGVPVAALLGVAVYLMIRELCRGYKYRRDPLYRGIIFGCLLSVVFMLLHALVEFNFRIPANAVYFFAISALGIAACRIGRRRASSHT